MTSPLPKWRLIDLDTGEEVEGQYPPTDLERDIGTNYAETWTMGREDPILQWTHGAARMVRFRARLFAAHSQDTIQFLLDRLIQFAERDEELNRPHICQFVVGTVINERVIVRNIGEVAYDQPRPDGSARGCRLTVTLQRYTPFDIELTDPNAPQPSTRYYRAVEGETYEHIARMLYQSPELGDLIRRRQPDKPELSAGDLVIAPEPSEVRRERIEPYSVPLTRTAAFVDLRRWVFERANAAFESRILRSS